MFEGFNIFKKKQASPEIQKPILPPGSGDTGQGKGRYEAAVYEERAHTDTAATEASMNKEDDLAALQKTAVEDRGMRKNQERRQTLGQ